MFRKGCDSTRTRRAFETLTEYLRRQGPATAQDIVELLHLSRAETYQFIHKALNRGLIRAVAHVHSDRNHQPRAWDIDSPDRELLWLRQERIRGRFCTCVPTGAATPGGAPR